MPSGDLHMFLRFETAIIFTAEDRSDIDELVQRDVAYLRNVHYITHDIEKHYVDYIWNVTHYPLSDMLFERNSAKFEEWVNEQIELARLLRRKEVCRWCYNLEPGDSDRGCSECGAEEYAPDMEEDDDSETIEPTQIVERDVRNPPADPEAYKSVPFAEFKDENTEGRTSPFEKRDHEFLVQVETTPEVRKRTTVPVSDTRAMVASELGNCEMSTTLKKYKLTEESWSSNPFCKGCAEGQMNQLAHMEEGGCLRSISGDCEFF